MIHCSSRSSRPSRPLQVPCSSFGSGCFLHLEHHVGEAGVEAHHVALLHLDLVLLQQLHQLVVAHRVAAAAEVVVQIDHHAAALRAMLGQVLDAERLRFACPRSAPKVPSPCLPGREPGPRRRGSRCRTRSRALPSPSASKRLPMWANESHCVEYCSASSTLVVADHVGQVGLVVGERKAEVLLARALAVADRRREARRAAARVERRRRRDSRAAAKARSVMPSFTSAMPCSTFSRVT